MNAINQNYKKEVSVSVIKEWDPIKNHDVNVGKAMKNSELFKNSFKELWKNLVYDGDAGNIWNDLSSRGYMNDFFQQLKEDLFETRPESATKFKIVDYLEWSPAFGIGNIFLKTADAPGSKEYEMMGSIRDKFGGKEKDTEKPELRFEQNIMKESLLHKIEYEFFVKEYKTTMTIKLGNIKKESFILKERPILTDLEKWKAFENMDLYYRSKKSSGRKVLEEANQRQKASKWYNYAISKGKPTPSVYIIDFVYKADVTIMGSFPKEDGLVVEYQYKNIPIAFSFVKFDSEKIGSEIMLKYSDKYWLKQNVESGTVWNIKWLLTTKVDKNKWYKHAKLRADEEVIQEEASLHTPEDDMRKQSEIMKKEPEKNDGEDTNVRIKSAVVMEEGEKKASEEAEASVSVKEEWEKEAKNANMTIKQYNKIAATIMKHEEEIQKVKAEKKRDDIKERARIRDKKKIKGQAQGKLNNNFEDDEGQSCCGRCTIL